LSFHKAPVSKIIVTGLPGGSLLWLHANKFFCEEPQISRLDPANPATDLQRPKQQHEYALVTAKCKEKRLYFFYIINNSKNPAICRIFFEKTCFSMKKLPPAQNITDSHIN